MTTPPVADHEARAPDLNLLAGLNSEQAAAVTHLHGPLKIVAGAGTGKTGTLTRRFAYLVHRGVAPDRILVLTLSRRAATEFRERVLGCWMPRILASGSAPSMASASASCARSESASVDSG